MADIKRNLVFLSENITNLPKILLYLIQEDIISKDERERIKSKETSLERNEELLLNLMKSDWQKNKSIFLRILRETNNDHCACKIEDESVKIGANEIGQLLSAAKEISSHVWFGFTAPNMIYVGREKETELLQKYWSDCLTKKTLSFVSVTGLGGVGKSELATNFAKWFYETVQGHCIWIEAESDQSLIHSFNNLAGELKISLKDDLGKEKEFLKILEEVYEKLFGEKLLLVFDNLENYGHEALKVLIRLSSKKPPTVLKPFVITTSRIVEAKKRALCNRLELQVLSKESAIHFFDKSLNIEDTKDDSINELIEKLCHRLQCYPLAMQQASAYIHERMLFCGTVHEAVANYITEIEIQTKALLDYKIPEYEAMDDISKTTFLTWRITIAKLKESEEGGEMALNIINVISFLSPDNIPIHMVKSILQKVGEVSNIDNIDNLCELIRRYSMINFVGEKLISVHRLVQEVTRIELEEKEGFYSILNEIAKRMPVMMKEKQVALKDLVHVQVVWQHVSKKKEMVKDHVTLPALICNKLLLSGKDRDLLNFSSESGNLMESVLGQNNKWTLEINYWTGVALKYLGEHLKSLEVLKNVYKNQKEILGEKNDDFLETAFEIGNVYCYLKKYKAALKMYNYTLEKTERFYGKEHPYVLAVKSSITMALAEQNNSEKTNQKAYGELLKTKKQFLKVDDPLALAVKYENIAHAKLTQKDYEGALKELEEALQIRERVQGLDHLEILIKKLGISNIYFHLGRNEENLHLLNKLHEKMTQLYGPRHPKITDLERRIEVVQMLIRLRSRIDSKQK